MAIAIGVIVWIILSFPLAVFVGKVLRNRSEELEE